MVYNLKSLNLAQASSTDIATRTPLVEAHNLGVFYDDHQGKRDDFKSHVHNLIQGSRTQGNRFWALREVSFKLYPGDVVGIIGHNGAGKTTLCRIISGLLRPNEGTVKVAGSVSSLLSLGAGFENELSGNENIILNGMMLGMSRDQINQSMIGIQKFSGLGDFLESPFKSYSRGMKARLGFSVATAMDAEILVIDEILGPGDINFKQRAIKRIWELVDNAKLVIVVSHDIDFVMDNCNKVLWFDQGKLKLIGKPGEVVHRYQQEVGVYKKPKKKKVVSVAETNVKVKNNPVIQAEELGFRYKINRKPFWALQNVSFQVREKDIVGIIGHNGAGKTTLCRVLSGIYRQNCGFLKVDGNVTALFSFGIGFQPALAGIDNIYLNGMMLGITKEKIRNLEKEIVEFAELENFIDKPVKEYSKGMKARLGFSIAAALRPEIFIVDEALSTGDIGFQQKAIQKMQEMIEQAKAVLIVTHSLGIVEQACTRALWMNQGRVLYDGAPVEAVHLYNSSVSDK